MAGLPDSLQLCRKLQSRNSALHLFVHVAWDKNIYWMSKWKNKLIKIIHFHFQYYLALFLYSQYISYTFSIW